MLSNAKNWDEQNEKPEILAKKHFLSLLFLSFFVLLRTFERFQRKKLQYFLFRIKNIRNFAPI